MFTREALEEVNAKMGTILIEKKGKKTNYVMVNERVKAFRALCPGGLITTEIIGMEDGVVTMKAEVRDENGNLLATGMAQEKETSSFVNNTSYIENCETSAVGRALGFAGIGIDGSMASAEEVANAIMNQNAEKIKKQKIDGTKVKVLVQKCMDSGVNSEKLCGLYKVENYTQLNEDQFADMMKHWEEIVKRCS